MTQSAMDFYAYWNGTEVADLWTTVSLITGTGDYRSLLLCVAILGLICVCAGRGRQEPGRRHHRLDLRHDFHLHGGLRAARRHRRQGRALGPRAGRAKRAGSASAGPPPSSPASPTGSPTPSKPRSGTSTPRSTRALASPSRSGS